LHRPLSGQTIKFCLGRTPARVCVVDGFDSEIYKFN
jgi:hypothetical protein